MGLRCLLGHDFDDPELQREREEQGDEVVVTVREEKTCTRCGYTKTVSENKEVTSIEQLAETAAGGSATSDESEAAATADADKPAATAGQTAATDDTGSDTPTDTETTSEPTTAGADGSAEDAEILDDGEEGSSEPTPTTADATEESPTAETDDTEPQAADDDGIILSAPDDEGDETADNAAMDEPAETEAEAREPGEWDWPEHETDPETSTQGWPEQSGDDEGYDAETPPDEQPDEVSFSGGFTPEATAGTAGGQTGVSIQAGEEVIEEPADAELTKAGEASLYEPTVDDINTEFYCPECGFTRHAGESSMRAGDICPECQRGYIAEREL
jgi:hypothetical protein